MYKILPIYALQTHTIKIKGYNRTLDELKKQVLKTNMDISKIKLIAFDLDGTLTQHKTPLSAEHK